MRCTRPSWRGSYRWWSIQGISWWTSIRDGRSASVVLVDFDGCQILTCEREVELTKIMDQLPVVFMNYDRHPDNAIFFHDARGVTKLRCQHIDDLLKLCTAKRGLKRYAGLKRPADSHTAPFLVYDSDDERAVVQNARAVKRELSTGAVAEGEPAVKVRQAGAGGHRTSRSQVNPRKELLLQSSGQLRLRQRSPNFLTAATFGALGQPWRKPSLSSHLDYFLSSRPSTGDHLTVLKEFATLAEQLTAPSSRNVILVLRWRCMPAAVRFSRGCAVRVRRILEDLAKLNSTGASLLPDTVAYRCSANQKLR